MTPMVTPPKQLKQPKTAFIAGTKYLTTNEVNEMVDCAGYLGLDLKWDLEDEADVILYAGGSDISPSLYGEKALASTGPCNPMRDGYEVYTYEVGRSYGAIHVGICRGMQLLNVMNGGKLWQHVDNHESNHGIEVLQPDPKKNYVLGDGVTSSHHQVIIPPRNGNEKHNPYFITAKAMGVNKRVPVQRWISNYTSRAMPDFEEIEGIWFPNTKTFGVQFHPGWNATSAKVFKDLFDSWVRKESKACAA